MDHFCLQLLKELVELSVVLGVVPVLLVDSRNGGSLEGREVLTFVS